MDIVLYPQLCPGLRDELLDLRLRCGTLLRVATRRRRRERQLLTEMIEVAAQDHRPGPGQANEERLVAWSMAGREHQHHRAVAEDVVIALQDLAPHAFEAVEISLVRQRRRPEDRVALSPLHQPGGF